MALDEHESDSKKEKRGKSGDKRNGKEESLIISHKDDMGKNESLQY